MTATVPCSHGEEVFVQDELTAMLGVLPDLVVVPMRMREAEPNEASVRSGLAGRVVGVGLHSPAVFIGAATTLVTHPIRSVRAIAAVLGGTRGARNVGVNLASIPKALWLAGILRRRSVRHVHAYWLSHTSTAAMISARVAGIPWSASAFRWDVAAANALGPKLATAEFVRVADGLAREELEAVRSTQRGTCPLVTIRTGVLVPPTLDPVRPVSTNVLCCPAAFVPKKGHDVLLSALASLVTQHREIRLHLFGDGPLRGLVEERVHRLGLEGFVELHGNVPLAELRRFLAEIRPICVLPSLRTADGQVEGIPVSLVEAMALGAPVVSTRSGSIAELVVDGTGVLADPGDSESLAAAIRRLVDAPELATDLARAAYERVAVEFALERNATRLGQMCLEGGGLRATAS